MKMTGRRWAFVAGAFIAAGMVAWALVPDPVPVEVCTARRGPLEVTVLDDGMTRVRERYEVTAPVAGRLLRVEVHAGDTVQAGTPVAQLQPSPIDPKQEAQLTARLHAAERAASEAHALLRRATDASTRAATEAVRIRRLAHDAIASRDALEAAQAAASMAAREREAARFRAEATAFDVEVARAALGSGTQGVVVRSPIAGRVLQVLHESETVVTPGMPLIVVGDPRTMEVVADFLSTDAVKIAPGTPARLERWGGDVPVEARVRTVEPSAFTKVSALGVEEQRVNVICDPLEVPGGLGDQFRTDVRVVLWRGETLKVPSTALFATPTGWQVFTLENGRARVRSVRVGHVAEEEVEILGGIGEGTTVIRHPSDRVRDGIRAVPRAA